MDSVRVSTLDLTPENGISPDEKRFSKVNNRLCKLKVKVFSTDGVAKEIECSNPSDLAPVTSIDLGDEKMFNNKEEVTTEIVQEKTEGVQKNNSVTSIKFTSAIA